MIGETAVRTREKWVDDVKVIACILVVLGHFFQSMTKAAWVGLIVALGAKVLILTGGTAFTQYRLFSQTKSGLCSV